MGGSHIYELFDFRLGSRIDDGPCPLSISIKDQGGDYFHLLRLSQPGFLINRCV